MFLFKESCLPNDCCLFTMKDTWTQTHILAESHVPTEAESEVMLLQAEELQDFWHP